MEQKKGFRIGAGDVLLLVGSAAFLLGSLLVFGPCGPKEDGSWMTCHWAGNALSGLAAVLTVISLIHVFVPHARIKQGLSCGMIPVAILAALAPGHVVGLCMHADMRCHTVMAPSAMVFAVAIVVFAVIDLILQRKRG